MFKRIILIVCLVSTVSCAGGGGGDGGGGGRTKETALRLLHGSVIGVPVDVLIGGLLIQSARFGDVTSYVPVEKGQTVISVERANNPGTVEAALTNTFEKDTEYSLLLYATSSSGETRAVIFPEPIERPEKGFARVQVVNALEGSPSVALAVAGVSTVATPLATASGFVIVPAGLQQIVVRDANGNTLANQPITLVDRGESTILVTGSKSLGFVTTRQFDDLD